MKLASLRKGFTLVEIMIVVVIIGLLAALAVPAFKKVRNNAIEKTLFNDARQISSAANQFFSENGGLTTVTADLLIGNTRNFQKLSSGNVLVQGISAAGAAIPAQAAFTAISFSSSGDTSAPANKAFSIFNSNYESGLSSNGRLNGDIAAQTGGYGAAGATGSKHLNFAVDSGEVLTAAGIRWNSDGTFAAGTVMAGN